MGDAIGPEPQFASGVFSASQRNVPRETDKAFVAEGKDVVFVVAGQLLSRGLDGGEDERGGFAGERERTDGGFGRGSHGSIEILILIGNPALKIRMRGGPPTHPNFSRASG